MTMKKMLVPAVLGAVCLGAAFCACSCGTLTVEKLTSAVFGDSPGSAGRKMGKAAYTAYVYLKQDAKYDEYTAGLEKLYMEATETGKCDISVVNATAMKLCEKALARKGGTLEAGVIATGIRLAGGMADKLAGDTAKADEFTAGFMEGIADCIGSVTSAGDANAIEEKNGAGKTEEPFECKGGDCHVTGLDKDKTIAFQRKVVDKLLADYAVQETGLADITPYENLTHLKERLETLKEAGRSNTKIYVSAFVVKDSKLAELLILCDIDEPGGACQCVSCRPVEEELDMPD